MSDIPTDAFDWNRVHWRSQRMGRPRRCCYCDHELFETRPRLIVIEANGRGAEFCEACMTCYWPNPLPSPQRD